MNFDLDNVVDTLKKESKILVTGTCRSGTTITSHILADLLDYEFVESNTEEGEDTKHSAPTIGSFLSVIQEEGNMVIHGPHLHPFLQQVPKEVFIVYVVRKPQDITASTKRIYGGMWTDEFYTEHMRKLINPKHYKLYDKLSYAGKCHFVWDKYQKPRTSKWMEIDYEMLGWHRYFIPDNFRKKFKERQWRL